MLLDEFDIQEFVFETLKPLDIPVFFTARKESKLPLVVFNITGETGYEYWDDEETTTKYRISINIFSKGNYIKYKKQIKQLMKDAGFKRTDIPECQYQEDVEIFNQPMFFEYIKENYKSDKEILYKRKR